MESHEIKIPKKSVLDMPKYNSYGSMRGEEIQEVRIYIHLQIVSMRVPSDHSTFRATRPHLPPFITLPTKQKRIAGSTPSPVTNLRPAQFSWPQPSSFCDCTFSMGSFNIRPKFIDIIDSQYQLYYSL